MNYKKIIILPALFVLSNILYIGCCKCVDSNKHFYTIDSASVRLRSADFTTLDTGTILHVDSIFFNYLFNVNCVAQKDNPFRFLVNSAYACKCPECGYDGLKTKIASIVITSDSVYNGIPAGASLNSLFKGEIFQGGYTTVDSMKNVLNNNINFSASFLIATKPGNSHGHVFKLRILFTDGRELVVNTGRIFWS